MAQSEDYAVLKIVRTGVITSIKYQSVFRKIPQVCKLIIWWSNLGRNITAVVEKCRIFPGLPMTSLSQAFQELAMEMTAGCLRRPDSKPPLPIEINPSPRSGCKQFT